MTLSPLDDFPYHQAAEPMRFVATSDRNFYDRYYFNVLPRSGELIATCGLGTYPNRDVCDAFVAVTRGGTQHVVRASRQLGPDRTDLTCGPFRVEVVEPLRRVRFVLEPGDHDLAVDVTWHGSMPAQVEADQVIRHGAQITTDTKRFVQTSRLSGSIEVAGERIALDEDGWWGNRDRSWGVRGVGEPEAPGVRSTAPRVGFFWLYAIAQFETFTVVSMIEEDRTGARRLSHARRVWHDPERPPEDLGHPLQRDLELVPGTRQLRRGRVAFVRFGGEERVLDVECGPTSFLALGTGYGVEPDWRHGMWQGVGPVVQSRTYEATDAKGLQDNLGRFTFEGEEGIGLLEFSIMGPYDPLGL